ncbi:MAG: hypothetical protein WB239_00445, partial [Acidimicrobiia bacterium]
ELLATVVAEPASSLMPFTGTESIRSTIEAELAQLRADMDASVYAAAYERGTARPYDVVAKELVASSTSQT